MQKLFLYLLIIFISANTTAREGVILYENKTNLHMRLTSENEAMKAMMPEYRTIKEQLIFNSEATLYKAVPADDEEISKGNVRMTFKTPENEIYLDINSKIRTMLQEFMGKKYLMQDTLQIHPWKFGNEVMDILGYRCRMAYYTDTVRNVEITAWFTTDLPPFMGPANYNTLPGTVLAVDINNGENVLVARKIDLRPLQKNELKMPDKGIKISKPEYDKMVEEQMAKWQQQGVRIRQ